MQQLVAEAERKARNLKRKRLRARGNPAMVKQRENESVRLALQIAGTSLILRGWLHGFLLMTAIEARKMERELEPSLSRLILRRSYDLEEWSERRFSQYDPDLGVDGNTILKEPL